MPLVSNGVRLLICTQAYDSEDRALGFFVGWIEEFAKRFDHIEVLCLRRGKGPIPNNVNVTSLGAPSEAPRVVKRVRALMRLVSESWRLRGEYEAVFVHMNQEYVLGAGWLWKLLGKRVYFWRNHYEGSMLTNVAARFAKKVFYTSKHSYTAKFPHAIQMPVGVDVAQYEQSTARAPRSILWYARIAPSKRLEMFIEALSLLKGHGGTFSASVYGSPLPVDAVYYEEQKRRASDLGLSVSFHAGLPHRESAKVFGMHEIFVNTSRSGMYDKTIFEAATSGCIVLASSKDLAEEIGNEFYFDDVPELTAKLERFLSLPPVELEKLRTRSVQLAQKHSLKALGDRIATICAA